MNSESDVCTICDSDLSTLRSTLLPVEDPTWPKLRIADLFAGCGGLSLGMQRAAHSAGYALDVRLALDSDPVAVNMYRKTFPAAATFCEPIEQRLGGEMGSSLTPAEAALKRKVGQLDILLGGPPCQGHSNLNNHSRRDDPRNELYLRLARAAEILNPTTIIAENVPTVTLDVHKAVQKTVRWFRKFGYTVGEGVVDLSQLGVPQKRRRHVILAVQGRDIDPQELVEGLTTSICEHVPRTVRWAIADLEDVEASTPFDTPSRASPINQARIDWLFKNNEFDLPSEQRPPCHRPSHSYPAVYGRMSWDSPAPTLTTGFQYTGQGRYVHPSRRRTITPHEAARLQMLPDFVDLGSVSVRKHLAKLIGNTVPPPLSFALGQKIIPLLDGLSTT